MRKFLGKKIECIARSRLSFFVAQKYFLKEFFIFPAEKHSQTLKKAFRTTFETKTNAQHAISEKISSEFLCAPVFGWVSQAEYERAASPMRNRESLAFPSFSRPI